MDSKTLESRAPHQPRLEDDPLVRGLGRFAADAPMAGQAQAFFVRSPHAFADIRAIDIDAAKAVPGVLAVLTAADMEGIGNISQHPPVAGRGGAKLIIPHRPALAGKTVRHLGEPVAVVIAETLTAAQDASELVTVDYEEREPAVDLREAVREGAPQVWPEAPGNIAVDWLGMAADEASAKEVRASWRPRHVAKVLVHQRIAVLMEPRGSPQLRSVERKLLSALLLAERCAPRDGWRRPRVPRSACASPPRTSAGSGSRQAIRNTPPSVAARKIGRPVQDVEPLRGLPQRQPRP